RPRRQQHRADEPQPALNRDVRGAYVLMGEQRKEQLMWIPKRVLLVVSVAAVAAMSLALAVGAFGDRGGGHGGKALIRASLAPSVPTDPEFHGVTPGAAPWVLRRGDVEIKRHS